MALTLDDVVMRRTGIGQLGEPSSAALSTAVSIMADELGWNEARKEKEIGSVLAHFRTCGDVT